MITREEENDGDQRERETKYNKKNNTTTHPYLPFVVLLDYGYLQCATRVVSVGAFDRLSSATLSAFVSAVPILFSLRVRARARAPNNASADRWQYETLFKCPE